MRPAKKPIKIKTCVEKFLHHARHALTREKFYIKILSFDLKQ